MISPNLKIGTVVKFFFANRPPIAGPLVYSPVATGDCWVIEDPQDGYIYVQQFEYMYAPPQDADKEQVQ